MSSSAPHFRRLTGLFTSTTTTTAKPKPNITAATLEKLKVKTPKKKPRKPRNFTLETAIPAVSAAPTAEQLRSSDRNAMRLAEKFKKDARSERFRSRYMNLKVAVLRLAKTRHHSLIEEMFEDLKKYDEDITREQFVVQLINLYGQAGMFEHAQKLFDEMPRLNCPRTVVAFNTLLDACVSAGKFDKISGFFRDLPRELGIVPNTVSYNIVIKSFCEMGEMDSALHVIDEMERNGCEVDEVTFNTIIDAFSKKGRLDEADKIWALMESKNLAPNVRTYNYKLRGFISCGKMDEAVNVIGEMEQRGVRPDVFTYNALIQGFIKADNLDEVKRWYGEIADSGLETDRVTFVTVIPFACKKGDFLFAFELCKKALRKRIELHYIQHVVDQLAKNGMIEEADELVKRKKYGFKLILPSNE